VGTAMQLLRAPRKWPKSTCNIYLTLHFLKLRTCVDLAQLRSCSRWQPRPSAQHTACLSSHHHSSQADITSYTLLLELITRININWVINFNNWQHSYIVLQVHESLGTILQSKAQVYTLPLLLSQYSSMYQLRGFLLYQASTPLNSTR